MGGSYTGVLHVEVFAVKLQMEMDSRVKSGRFLCRGFDRKATNFRWTRPHIPKGHRTYAWTGAIRTHSWAECWHGECLCGLPTERPRWDIPAAVLSHSKRMTTGWLSKLLSGICLIWALCLHLPSAPLLKAAALPLFASLLGSEENDNNEAWRLSTASHRHSHL